MGSWRFIGGVMKEMLRLTVDLAMDNKEKAKELIELVKKNSGAMLTATIVSGTDVMWVEDMELVTLEEESKYWKTSWSKDGMPF